MIASFLGIPDPWIWMAYLLCLAATALCVIHALVRGRQQDTGPTSEAVRKAILEETKQGD
jgi:hypothetical protein